MPAVDSFDLRYHQTWRVGRSGEGFIQVHEQEDQNMQEDDDSPQDADGATRPGTRRQDTVERDVLEKLINYYFKHIAPMFPVITEHEFLHGIDEEEEPPSGGRANGFSRQPGRQASPKRDDRSRHTYEPPPVLLYAICTITATARHVPSRVFDSLRIMLNSVIRSEDVMSTATLSNIQALLIAGMTAEAHGRAPGQAMSAAWLRVSAAIRMVRKRSAALFECISRMYVLPSHAALSRLKILDYIVQKPSRRIYNFDGDYGRPASSVTAGLR